jgi:hypothetical protein
MRTPQIKQQAVLFLAISGAALMQAGTPQVVPPAVSASLEKIVRAASHSERTPVVDPLVLTEEQVQARAIEAKAAEPRRFRPLSDLLNALRNRRL